MKPIYHDTPYSAREKRTVIVLSVILGLIIGGFFYVSASERKRCKRECTRIEVRCEDQCRPDCVGGWWRWLWDYAGIRRCVNACEKACGDVYQTCVDSCPPRTPQSPMSPEGE